MRVASIGLRALNASLELLPSPSETQNVRRVC
jgi:hypothetical protein